MAKILLIDDDTNQNEMLSEYLTKENFVVEATASASDGMNLLTISEYDLVVMDWNMPEMQGVELLAWYRKRGGNSPVIMLTGRSDVYEKAEGLDTGADDYLVKPFDIREFLSRVRALLRRPKRMATVLSARGFTLDAALLTVSKNGEDIRLPPREFAVLEHLVRHPDEIIKGELLMKRVWRSESEATTDSLRTAIKNIRKKLNDDGIIETIAGVGYKLGQ